VGSQRISVPKKKHNVSEIESASIFRWKGGKPPTSLDKDEIQWLRLGLPIESNESANSHLFTWRRKKIQCPKRSDLFGIRRQWSPEIRKYYLTLSNVPRSTPIHSVFWQHSHDITKTMAYKYDTPPTRFGLQWPSSARCLWKGTVIMSNYIRGVKSLGASSPLCYNRKY
jgi:hypothetical protein